MMRLLPLLLLAGCASLPTDPISTLNRDVNSAMAYAEDEDTHGVSDKWVTTCPERGDCEDYALCKARRLLAQGYSPERLAVVVGFQRDTAHAVLLVDGKVLDNLTDRVVPLKETDLQPLYHCQLDGEYRIFMPGLTPRSGRFIKVTARPMTPKCAAALAELKQ